MNILIIGGGGREHAIAWKLAKSPKTEKLYCAPGNAGIASIAQCVDIAVTDITALSDFAIKNQIDLTVVGPEVPLTLGISDLFQKKGLRVLGPTKKGALLEASKTFAKEVMQKAGIPTADYRVFSSQEVARNYVLEKNCPLVVKADGLAAGKGVFPCRNTKSAIEAIDIIMLKKEFGDAGNTVVIEDFLDGEEASFICLTDGKTVIPLPSSQDHKPAYDNDCGPNTGGMGAYCPAPIVTPEIHEFAINKIMIPLVKTLADMGITYKGILYAGLMIQNGNPKVLEFNVRLGDPETQPIMFSLKSDLVELFNAVIDVTLDSAELEIDPKPSVCIVMASGGYPGKYEKGIEIHGLDLAALVNESFVFHAGTTLKDGKLVTNGGRVLGVTARGTTIGDAIDAAYDAASKIKWTGVHYRKDIAMKAMNK